MVAFPLSLTGIPPPFGFVGKVLLFGAVIETRYPWSAVIGIPVPAMAVGRALCDRAGHGADGAVCEGNSQLTQRAVRAVRVKAVIWLFNPQAGRPAA